MTDAWFPPGAVLEMHAHEWPILAITLGGSLATRIRSRHLACMQSWAWSEPAGEAHANEVQAGGARVLVMEVAPDHDTLARAVHSRLLDNITLQRDLNIAADARRALAEIHHGDELSGMVLDSLSLLILSRAARITSRRRFHAAKPLWLLRARDFLHEHFRRNVSLGEVSREVGVDPVTLTRQFKRAFGATPGEYARTCRIDWCLEQLLVTNDPISTIAHRAGFADQSHFTRACAERVGLPPATYRRAARR